MELMARITNPEVQIGDFLLPWGLLVGTIGFLLAWIVIWFLERKCWTRKVANLPLFFVALAVLFGCVAGLLLAP
mgnify:CR=1 FL=1|jgi:uncharacterized membrane protein SpoIIM required for sporulation